KYLGEIETIKWREKGIKSNIYRVGNLAFMQQNGKVQEDVEDNSFANYVKFIAQLGCIAEVLDEVEISPADITAQAIVKLFNKVELSNDTYHVFNPNLIRLSDMLTVKNQPLAKVSFDKFIDDLIDYLHNNDNSDLIGRFLLRMGWQEDQNFMSKFNLLILQNKTENILKNLKNFDFKWQKINVLSLNNTYLREIKIESKEALCQ
ncbi:hypothetical protein, partial [Fastidiosibacter lacustris]|uniref:hypothetical protein n=1 Tax=Fastidiosibacter lacustris TaxID=2056695 RepID=UPI0019571ADB